MPRRGVEGVTASGEGFGVRAGAEAVRARGSAAVVVGGCREVSGERNVVAAGVRGW
jgi:hypothetical protein